MENHVDHLEEKAEKELQIMWQERDRLQAQVLQLRRRLLLSQKQQELTAALDAQVGNGALCWHGLLCVPGPLYPRVPVPAAYELSGTSAPEPLQGERAGQRVDRCRLACPTCLAQTVSHPGEDRGEPGNPGCGGWARTSSTCKAQALQSSFRATLRPPF